MFLEIPIQDQLKTVLSGTLFMDTGQDQIQVKIF